MHLTLLAVCLLCLQGGAIAVSTVSLGTFRNCDVTLNSATSVSLRKQGVNFETTELSVTSTTAHIIVICSLWWVECHCHNCFRYDCDAYFSVCVVVKD